MCNTTAQKAADFAILHGQAGSMNLDNYQSPQRSISSTTIDDQQQVAIHHDQAVSSAMSASGLPTAAAVAHPHRNKAPHAFRKNPSSRLSTHPLRPLMHTGGSMMLPKELKARYGYHDGVYRSPAADRDASSRTNPGHEEQASSVEPDSNGSTRPWAQERLNQWITEDSKERQQRVVAEVNQEFKSEKSNVRVYSHPGCVWQVSPPHLLQYNPRDVHLYGWIPFADWRCGQQGRLSTIVVGVVSDLGLHLQCALLVGWTLLLHLNVFRLPLAAQYHLVKLFSTNWMGSIFNLATVVSASLSGALRAMHTPLV